MSTVTPKLGSIVSGKYELLSLLGSGGMGAVFEARNTLTGKHVALKWMHPELAESPSATQRFIREAQACSRIRHPNVIDVYDVLSVDDSLCLVMELLEGEPLTALMQRESTSLPELVNALLGAMRGVAAAHRAGIIHRDIKPDNIFLAREGDDRHVVPKVLDFGISKVSGAAEMSLTRAGAAMGTPLYMSVEQLSGIKDIDARTDIYAFGVILYQAVTGRSPFEADSFPVLIAKIMTEEAVAPKSIRSDVPTTLSRLIEWAMAKDREQRIASMEALIAELEPYGTEIGFRQQMTLRASELPAISTPGSRPSSRAAPQIKAMEPPAAEGSVTATPGPTEIATAPTEIAQEPIRTPPHRGKLWISAALMMLALAAWLWSSSTEEDPKLHVASPAPEPATGPVAAPSASSASSASSAQHAPSALQPSAPQPSAPQPSAQATAAPAIAAPASPAEPASPTAPVTRDARNPAKRKEPAATQAPKLAITPREPARGPALAPTTPALAPEKTTSPAATTAPQAPRRAGTMQRADF